MGRVPAEAGRSAFYLHSFIFLGTITGKPSDSVGPLAFFTSWVTLGEFNSLSLGFPTGTAGIKKSSPIAHTELIGERKELNKCIFPCKLSRGKARLRRVCLQVPETHKLY